MLVSFSNSLPESQQCFVDERMQVNLCTLFHCVSITLRLAAERLEALGGCGEAIDGCTDHFVKR